MIMSLKYDFEKQEDTTQPFKDPAEWIAENLANFIKLILMNIPFELRHEAGTETERPRIIKKVLENVADVSELICKGGARYEKREHVSSFFDWTWEAVMEFLFAGGLPTGRVKWKKEEIEKAKPKAVKLLVADIEIP